MGFWIFMLIMDLLLPFTMIGFGRYFMNRKYLPKPIIVNGRSNNGCETVSNSLIYNKEELRYEIDFDDLERKLAHERARLMLICNPQPHLDRTYPRRSITGMAPRQRKHQ